MRLMLVSTEFPPRPGGIGTHAHQLATNLQVCGWNVTVVSRQDYAAEQEVEAFNGDCAVSIERLYPVSPAVLEALGRWRIAARRIRQEQPDCLVASGSRSVWLVAALARRYRLPWLAVAHGTELRYTGWKAWLTRWAFQQASAVVCVSQYTSEQMELAGIRPRRTEIIPNGADESRFMRLSPQEVQSFRSAFGRDGARLLVTVGNVTERKGQDIVIRAMPKIVAEVPNAHYLIAGLPSRQAEYEQLATQLGVADHVHFLGRVASDDLMPLLNACDLFVMTSRHTEDGDFEGYGIAAVEAALCGLPAVVSAPSGLAEAIVDGQTGIAVPRDDPEATAQAIVALLQNDAQRRQMGEAARRRAVAEQTWAHRAADYDNVLRSIVAFSSTGTTSPSS